MKAIRTAWTERYRRARPENKQLAQLLKDCQSSLNDSASQISKQASLSATQIDVLKTEFSDALLIDRQSRQTETEQLRRQNEELLRRLRDVYKAADIVRSINYNAILWTIVLAIFGSSVATLLI